MHDVNHGGVDVLAPGDDSSVLDFKFPLVVEVRETFVTVQRPFVFGADLPNGDRNHVPEILLDGKVGPGLASFKQELPAIQDGRTHDPCSRAAVLHLSDVEVASVGDVVFLRHKNSPFKLPSTTLRPRSAVGVLVGSRSSECCSAVSEGGVSVQALCKEFSCGLEFVADEAEAKEPGAHRVFRVLGLLGFRACGLDLFGHLAEGQAKLNVALKLSGVEAVLLAARGCFELEKPELNRALGEGSVEVKHMVAAAVVVVVATVAFALAAVPDVCELRHRLGLLAVDLVEEVGVDRAAVSCNALAVNLEGACDEAFVAGHDVCQVAEGLGCVALGADVNVNSASSGRVALGARSAKDPDEFLQGFHVVVGEDRGDHLALFGFRPGDANVLREFPFAALGVPSAPGAVSVAAVGVFEAARSEKVGGCLGCCPAGDVVHFNLNPDGLLLHLVDLVHGLVVHFSASLKVCVFLWCDTYSL